MNLETLAESLPELALLLRRDGTLLAHLGGRELGWLRPSAIAEAQAPRTLNEVWPEPFATHLLQLTRRAIALREPLDSEFHDGDRGCEIRVTPQSPELAVCVIKHSMRTAEQTVSPSVERPALDRRGFLRRFRNSTSMAALNEKPLAVALIEIDGITDLTRILDAKLSDQVIAAAIGRANAALPQAPAHWYLGQLSQNLLVVVLDTTERDAIEGCVGAICSGLREPVDLGDAQFHLMPHAGVAILGRDATAPDDLLDRARASAVEARRAGDERICFFSDTLQLRSLARLDVARELGDAIANGDIGLRYAPRHDLQSGRMVALVGYLRWAHPMRGEVKPAEFLRVAEATGQSMALSRSMLMKLENDLKRLAQQAPPHIRISFGPLRQHVLSDDFTDDIQAILARGAICADRLELRISERSYVSGDTAVWHSLASQGVQLVVDEFGRHMSSLDLLARVPLWGLQLDRSWTTAVSHDAIAGRVCRAVVNVARGLGVIPIGTGVDSESQRESLLQLGCVQGLGDLFPLEVGAAEPQLTEAVR